MRSRPYQSGGYQNKPRINQLEKFDSETAQGESLKLKLWKDCVHIAGRVYVCSQSQNQQQQWVIDIHTKWVTTHSLPSTGFPSDHDRVIFSNHPWSQTPSPQQQNKSVKNFPLQEHHLMALRFLNLSGYHCRARNNGSSPRLGGMSTPTSEHQPYSGPFQLVKYRLKKKKLGDKLCKYIWYGYT